MTVRRTGRPIWCGLQFGDRVLLEAGPNRGACHARNRGLAIAREQGADYVLFLDADDYLEGDMLAGAGAVAQAQDADMVLSDMHVEYPDGRRDLRFHYAGHVTPRDLFFGWMHSRYVNPSGILWRCAFVEGIGGWDESLARAQDRADHSARHAARSGDLEERPGRGHPCARQYGVDECRPVGKGPA